MATKQNKSGVTLHTCACKQQCIKQFSLMKSSGGEKTQSSNFNLMQASKKLFKFLHVRADIEALRTNKKCKKNAKSTQTRLSCITLIEQKVRLKRH
jgi:hypothetical protein